METSDSNPHDVALSECDRVSCAGVSKDNVSSRAGPFMT